MKAENKIKQRVMSLNEDEIRITESCLAWICANAVTVLF